jgi:hypothetical protein
VQQQLTVRLRARPEAPAVSAGARGQVGRRAGGGQGEAERLGGALRAGDEHGVQALGEQGEAGEGREAGPGHELGAREGRGDRAADQRRRSQARATRASTPSSAATAALRRKSSAWSAVIAVTQSCADG